MAFGSVDLEQHRARFFEVTVGRVALAVFLLAAGTAHFLAPQEFLAQVPTWLPARSAIVWISGAIEIGLAVALIAVPRHRVAIGWIVAGFFVLVFPGNLWQAITGAEAFGLDSAFGRWLRLLFQPVLVAWALWSTGAWVAWRQRTAGARRDEGCRAGGS